MMGGMKKSAWRGFAGARDRFRALTETLGRELPELQTLQEKLIRGRSGPAYPVETPVVYNRALDEAGPDTEFRLILVADNPGRREQAAENRRYLVGPSGKMAEKFFQDHPAWGIGFRENVLILNKTPIHTPRTLELRDLGQGGSPPALAALAQGLESSQRTMAELLLDFHLALAPIPVWIIGYSEMRRGGVFQTYTETLRALYQNRVSRREELLLFRHFSMNQFTIDLKRQRQAGESPEESLTRIGTSYRERILGW
jgi:hypothetical protein